MVITQCLALTLAFLCASPDFVFHCIIFRWTTPYSLLKSFEKGSTSRHVSVPQLMDRLLMWSIQQRFREKEHKMTLGRSPIQLMLCSGVIALRNYKMLRIHQSLA